MSSLSKSLEILNELGSLLPGERVEVLEVAGSLFGVDTSRQSERGGV